MTDPLTSVAPAFVEMAHSIVWCSAATVDGSGRPRSRILHPIWEWNGEQLVGWIATSPSPVKRAHLANAPAMSCSYWTPGQDTCEAAVTATWCVDAPTRERVWSLFENGPTPVGYDPRLIPGWESPASESFLALRLDPWFLRVFPGSVLLGGGGHVLVWRAEPST